MICPQCHGSGEVPDDELGRAVHEEADANLRDGEGLRVFRLREPVAPDEQSVTGRIGVQE